jgi:UDP-N-acetylglucosamine---dolichyl-phosphate N-acetylglucosaminyltransferase
MQDFQSTRTSSTNPKLSKDVFILIPAYLEEPSIKTVIEDLRNCGYHNIIAIDDGSTDQTYDEALKCDGVYIARHLINRGKGAAIRTGIEIAKKLKAQSVVTFDADGQHDPDDIKKLLEILEKGYDVALGVRSFDPTRMPRSKIIANTIANIVTWLLFGVHTSDSQSGLRAYNRRALDLIDTKADRYSYEPEVLKEIKRHNLSYQEVSINTIYTRHSSSKSERQGFITGLKTLFKLISSV